MATKFIQRLVLITMPIVFLSSFQCNKSETMPCQFGGYSFAVTSEWSPQRETYNVGDTIFLTSIFPKTLTDQINPSMIVDYINSVGIGGDIGIAAFDSISHQVISAKDSFQFVSLAGAFLERPINKSQGINISYVELNSSYQFQGGVVCNKKGLYGISVDNLISRGIRGKNCTNAGFSMTLTNSEKHFYLYEQALGHPNDADGERRGYIFRVQ